MKQTYISTKNTAFFNQTGHRNRLIFIGILFIISLSSVSAVKIVYLTDKINQNECNKVINSISNKYYSGVSRIVIYNKLTNGYAGYYSYPSKQISLDNDYCNKEVLIHELAHHYQFINGDSRYCITNHCQRFDYYLEKLTNEI